MTWVTRCDFCGRLPHDAIEMKSYTLGTVHFCDTKCLDAYEIELKQKTK